MHKDFKIGLMIGSVIAAVGILWLATRPSLSTKARLLNSTNPTPPLKLTQPPRFTTALPTPYPAEPEKENKPPLTAHKQPQKTIHIVAKGETLSDISNSYYGSANKWSKILNANRIKDINKIKPGTRLIIPR